MDLEQQSKFAIHEAAREGRTAAVESLINANPRLATKRDDDERLPLHWAASYNHMPVVELLVSRKDFEPDVQDASGWTPLMIASSLREGDELVDMLLSKEADVNCKNYSGQTALHFTASKNNLETARKLISYKASARVKDKRGQLPLHRAAAIGSVPMVNLLLENRSPLNATDISGLTALHHAISEGHGDTALVLLRAGAETDKKDVDGNLAIDLAPDKKIRSFILQACEREGLEIEETK
ncbi:Ankyrin-2 [Mycoblastus sanguinarius]|nr:Ankyrin-2 [Mycoblastus sanguinarius]